MATIEVLESIEEIDRGEWDELCGDRPFADYRWLRLTERVLVAHKPRYVLLRRQGRLEAGAVCALIHHFESQARQRRAGALLQRFPCLRCAVPIALDPGLVLRPGCDAAQIIPAALAAVERVAARERASFWRFDYLSQHESAWPALQRRGYHRLPMWTETSLDLAGTSFETYLTGLPSRKRHQITRILRQAERDGITMETLHPSDDEAPLLRRLVGHVLARHGAHEAYAPDLFPRAAALLGNDFVLIVARRAGRIAGCAALLRDRGEVTAKWLGLDYTHTLGTATYQRLLVECVAQAAALGARRLRTGATAYETKRHLGVVTEERFGALAVRGRLLHRVAGMALALTGGSAVEPNGVEKNDTREVA